MILIFNLFGKNTENSQETQTHLNNQNVNSEKDTVMENYEDALKAIEKYTEHINVKKTYSALVSFISYYYFMIEYYKENKENIISVQEIMSLKYIDNVKNILSNITQDTYDKNKSEQLYKTLLAINDRLYDMIKNVKEQKDMNLTIDLKTMEDLVRTDF